MASTIKRIALQNKSSGKISFDDLARLAPVLQTQSDRDFTPLWGVRAQISVLQKGDPVPTGVWPVYFLDPNDPDAGDGSFLGVHQDKDGQPYAYVLDTGDWTVTASHELLEMLADPFGNTLKSGPDMDPQSDGHQVNYLVEVGDPCETFSYTIDSIKVTDFVTKDYYLANTNGPYDYMGQLSKPFEVPPPGCYISWQDPKDGHWHQKTPDGQFTDIGAIDSRKNPRDDRDSLSGEKEEGRHNLQKILSAYQQKSKKN